MAEKEILFYEQNGYNPIVVGWKKYAGGEKTEQVEKIISPIAHYLENVKECRVPFGNWYKTQIGEYHQFIARSVKGGIFMPMLMRKG